MLGSTNVSGRATPHPLQRGGAQSGSPEWRVGASRPLAEATPTTPPAVSRLVELEVSRHHQTETLLSRLLPGRLQRQATPTQVPVARILISSLQVQIKLHKLIYWQSLYFGVHPVCHLKTYMIVNVI